ncbi:MAG: helix-turn-helix domain-containing protein [Gammaproteobacteria bacterium]|jgi:AraC-like DNA-binding protein
MEPIPLVRARYAYAFAIVLDKLGVPLDKLLQDVKLPRNLLENPDRLITAHQLWAFAGHAAQEADLPELGMIAGQVPVVEHGDFGKMVYEAITLYDAIQTFCDNAKIEYSRADFYLTRDQQQAWFCRGPIDGDDAMQRQQVELYVLIMMIDTIRLGAGFQWQPSTIQLQTNDTKGLRDVPLLRNADITFACKRSGIAFPLEFLSKPLHGDIAAFTKPKNQPDDILMHTDFGASLRLVLKNYLIGQTPTLDTTAEIVGIKPRTLQRRLSQAGLSYQGIIDQTRFELAAELIKDSNLKLTDIAYELGYSDAGHFTRAFRRWAGMTPREYRRYHAV